VNLHFNLLIAITMNSTIRKISNDPNYARDLIHIKIILQRFYLKYNKII
jgi:hypothetical protein